MVSLDRNLPLFPSHEVYLSGFGGSGVDILHKPPSKLEIFNDLDVDIVNLFTVARFEPQNLKQLLRTTPARSRVTYETALEILQDETYVDPLQRAWAFLVASHQGFRTKHPALHLCSDFATLKKPHSSIRQWRRLDERLDLLTERFCDVVLEALDFRIAIPKYDGHDTFSFLDPPYHPATRQIGFYQCELSEADHNDLCNIANNAKGKIMICGYDNPIYQQRLRNWNRQTFERRTHQGRRTVRTEVVWMNYDVERVE